MINVFIDYDIILQSDLDTLKDELELIIATGKYIFELAQQKQKVGDYNNM